MRFDKCCRCANSPVKRVAGNQNLVARDRVAQLEVDVNPAAFGQVTASGLVYPAYPPLAPGQTFAHLYGNAGRGILRGPAQYNFDFSIFKDFQFKESMKLELRGEAFNLFNTPQFAIPNNTVDIPGLSGSISSTVHSSRQLQIAVLFKF